MARRHEDQIRDWFPPKRYELALATGSCGCSRIKRNAIREPFVRAAQARRLSRDRAMPVLPASVRRCGLAVEIEHLHTLFASTTFSLAFARRATQPSLVITGGVGGA